MLAEVNEIVVSAAYDPARNVVRIDCEGGDVALTPQQFEALFTKLPEETE